MSIGTNDSQCHGIQPKILKKIHKIITAADNLLPCDTLNISSIDIPHYDTILPLSVYLTTQQDTT